MFTWTSVHWTYWSQQLIQTPHCSRTGCRSSAAFFSDNSINCGITSSETNGTCRWIYIPFSLRPRIVCIVSLSVEHPILGRMVKITFLKWCKCVGFIWNLKALPTCFAQKFNLCLARRLFPPLLRSSSMTTLRETKKMQKVYFRPREAKFRVRETNSISICTPLEAGFINPVWSSLRCTFGGQVWTWVVLFYCELPRSNAIQ